MKDMTSRLYTRFKQPRAQIEHALRVAPHHVQRLVLLVGGDAVPLQQRTLRHTVCTTSGSKAWQSTLLRLTVPVAFGGEGLGAGESAVRFRPLFLTHHL